jgi:hypothetical protein
MSSPPPSSDGHPIVSYSSTLPFSFVWSLYVDKIRNPQRYLPPGAVQSVEIVYDSLTERPSLTSSELLELNNGIAESVYNPMPVSSSELERFSQLVGTNEFVHRIMKVNMGSRQAIMNELITVESLNDQNGQIKEQTVHFHWLDHPSEEGEIFNRLRQEKGKVFMEWGAFKFLRSTEESGVIGVAPPNSSAFFAPVVKHFKEDSEKKYEKLKSIREAQNKQ